MKHKIQRRALSLSKITFLFLFPLSSLFLFLFNFSLLILLQLLSSYSSSASASLFLFFFSSSFSSSSSYSSSASLSLLLLLQLLSVKSAQINHPFLSSKLSINQFPPQSGSLLFNVVSQTSHIYLVFTYSSCVVTRRHAPFTWFLLSGHAYHSHFIVTLERMINELFFSWLLNPWLFWCVYFRVVFIYNMIQHKDHICKDAQIDICKHTCFRICICICIFVYVYVGCIFFKFYFRFFLPVLS